MKIIDQIKEHRAYQSECAAYRAALIVDCQAANRLADSEQIAHQLQADLQAKYQERIDASADKHGIDNRQGITVAGVVASRLGGER